MFNQIITYHFNLRKKEDVAYGELNQIMNNYHAQHHTHM